MKYLYSLILTLILIKSLYSELKTSSVFSSGMVLQRDQIISVWGTSSSDAKVTIEFQGQKVVANPLNGKWHVELQPLRTGGPFEMKIKCQEEVVVYEDILVGEVWLMSGQSNMQMSLCFTTNGKEEIKQANFDNIRILSVKSQSSISPQDNPNIEIQWKPCKSENIEWISGVGFHFVKKLQETLGKEVPIGFIGSYQGGTRVESWTSYSTLEQDPQSKPLLARYQEELKKLDQNKAKYERETEEWNSKRSKKIPAGERPELPLGMGNFNTPGGLYNGQIYPLAPYGIRGVLWYQGESNANEFNGSYATLLTNLISDWRKLFKQEFHFCIIQVPFANEMAACSWVQDSQRRVADIVKNTSLVTTLDLGELENIHPLNKKPVGERGAQAVLVSVYDKKGVASGPLLQSIKREENKIIMRFRNIGSGLVLKQGTISGFEIEDENGTFLNTSASLNGETVIVEIPEEVKIQKLRYGWNDQEHCTLTNREGYPASPFLENIPQ